MVYVRSDIPDIGLIVHNRYAPFQYTKDGQEVMERLWKETIKELGPLGVSDILNPL